MPYRDPQAKREWERQHRSQRLARRRQLRQIEAAQKEAQPETFGGISFLVPVVAGGALAAYSPKLAIGTGGLTLAIAGIYKKGWTWWIIGVLIIALGFFFYWSDQDGEKQS
jgi:hypothetical protein